MIAIGFVVIANGPKSDRKIVGGVVSLAEFVGVACEWGLRAFASRTLDLSRGAIEVEGNVVRHLSDTGDVVAEVDLTEPHRVEYDWQVFGNAIYHVRQGAADLEFSSSVQGAERLVRETLRHSEWPPGSNDT